MPAIVEYPQVVREAVDEFGDLFSCEPQRRHFAEYLTGLMIAANKTVTGINREFVETTDQSCLNRFLTEVDWDEQALNERRLELLQRDPTTRYSDQGVIALDDTLIDHDGKFIKDVGWFWDHAEDRHKIAHDYLFVNYVCTSGKHYPLEFRRFKKREQCEATGETFQDHTAVVLPVGRLGLRAGNPRRFHVRQLLHQRRQPQPHPLQAGPARAAAGLRGRPEVQSQGAVEGEGTAGRRPGGDRFRRKTARNCVAATSGNGTSPRTLHIPKVNHKVRIVILWNHRRDAEPCKILVTNRTTWEVCRICADVSASLDRHGDLSSGR